MGEKGEIVTNDQRTEVCPGPPDEDTDENTREVWYSTGHTPVQVPVEPERGTSTRGEDDEKMGRCR